MARYWAEIGDTGLVLRVLVAEDEAWLTSNLGGTWVETADPYSDSPQELNYAGVGHGFDATHPARFAPPWEEPRGNAQGYPEGAHVFHEGRIWKSAANGNRNRPPGAGSGKSPVWTSES